MPPLFTKIPPAATVTPPRACTLPPCSTPEAKTLPPTLRLLPVIVAPPLATVRPVFTVAPAFRKAAPVVVRVLLIAVGRLRVTCVGVIELPPHVKVPAPMLDTFPKKVAVERAMVEGMVGVPEVGG